MGDAIPNGIDLGSNAFMLIHGWTAGPLLLEFVARFLDPLRDNPMTLADMWAQANPGPLAITLRTCAILGYVSFDIETGEYSAVAGNELDELRTFLSPGSSSAKAIASIYVDAIPPFRVPSEEATSCLRTWMEQRPTWAQTKSKALATMLDGVVLAPLLTSIAYFSGKRAGAAMEKFDFSHVDLSSQRVLRSIFNELKVGRMNQDGVVELNAQGVLALQRCYSYFVPMSYSPMLNHFKCILYHDASWGFCGTGQDTEERAVHVERALNAVGSGAQRRPFFKDMMSHITRVFGGEDFASQPHVVVDTGSGDGQLLLDIYEHVKTHTMRGMVLPEYPLMLIGVDAKARSRTATSRKLGHFGIPHSVTFGEIGVPSEIMNALHEKGTSMNEVLHVRSFMDHTRPYIAPSHELLEGSALAAFAKSQMADFAHLDKHGRPITAYAAFASLIEHFERWGVAIKDSFGLVLLEVMMLDVPTSARFLNDCVSFHFDIVQCLSRQYMSSAMAFALAAGMAGLLPIRPDSVKTYPEQGKYCRMMHQHLVPRQFKVRLAERSDIQRLVEIDSLSWDMNLRASEAKLLRRLVCL